MYNGRILMEKGLIAVRMGVSVKLVREGARLPAYGSAGAAGADLYACLAEEAVLAPGETRLIPTGVAVALPAGTVGLVYARSGLATKRDLAPANKVGVIDEDYRGEILVPLRNHGAVCQRVAPGERIAQMVITPYITADFSVTEDLNGTLRGEGGFGSTGV